jgi:peptide/nickel transport system substrate-binding protein
MNTYYLKPLLTLIAIALLTACSAFPIPSSPTPTSLPTPAPPTPTPLPRGGTLNIRLASDIPNLRPWQPRSRSEEQVISLLYSGLTRLDTSMQPQPDLAESWQSSADGLQITMTLRSGLAWHDGTPITAEDAAFTLGALRAISPTTALLSDLQRISAISTPAPDTLVLVLSERYAPIFSMLTLPILPKHLLVGKELAAYDFWQLPTGSGPFQFQQRQPGRTITLAANPRFYRGAPLLDAITFQVLPDANADITAIDDSSLDLAEVPWEQAKTIAADPSVRVAGYPENGYYYLALNTRQGRTTADPRVRQALAAVLDLRQIIAETTLGQGIPIASSSLPGSWADLTAVPTTTVNLDRARLLLDEAGWKLLAGSAIRQQNGITLTLQLLVRNDDPRRVQAARLISQAAAQVGVAVQVQAADFATAILPRFAPPYDFDLLLASWSNGVGDPSYADQRYYDPDDFNLFHSSQINQGSADLRGVLNITGFSDSEYDQYAVAARQIYEPAERIKALRQAQQRVATLYPYIFLWNDTMPVVLSQQVTTLDGEVDITTANYFWNIERWHLRR